MGMKVNFINLDINSSGNLAMHIRQSSFDELNCNKQMTGSLFQQKGPGLSPSTYLSLNSDSINLPIINGLSINGIIQNNEKNILKSPVVQNNNNNNFSEYFNSPIQKIVKPLNQNHFMQLNRTNRQNRNKINAVLPLGNLLKQIGEAISRNQTNQNIVNLISKIPNSNTNKNTSYRFMKK